MEKLSNIIKIYDYSSLEEMKSHTEKMKDKGYTVIENGMFNGAFDSKEIIGSDKYNYTCAFINNI